MNEALWLLLVLLVAEAAGAAPWVADISEVATIPPGTKSVTISLPAGERATVGVYEVARVEVECPPTIGAEVFVVDEPDRPYWLPPPRWRRPGQPVQGPYAVRLHAMAEGMHLVRIVCDGGPAEVTVYLQVTPPVPKPDMGFGYYFVPAYMRYEGYLQGQWRRYFEYLRDLGCNTLTVYCGYPARTGDPSRNIAWQLDLAVETGLTDGNTPIFVFAASPTQLDAAYGYGKHVDKWPELCGYGKDEPGPGDEAEARAMVQMFHNRANPGQRHYRAGSAISSAESIMRFGDGLDIWIVLMDTLTDIIKRRVREQRKELWVYCCELRGTNAPLNRYFTGWWAYKNRPRCLMSWVAFDEMTVHNSNVKQPSSVHPDGRWTPCGYYEYLLQAPDGPVSSVGAEARRDGIVDYMVLSQLERAIERSEKYELATEAGRWLQDQVDKVDTNFWPNDEVPWGSGVNGEPLHWVLKDHALPPITDFNALRAKALEFIDQLA